MGRTRRDCPLCEAKNLLRLDHHLESMHGLKGEEKRKWLKTKLQRRTDVIYQNSDADKPHSLQEKSSGHETIVQSLALEKPPAMQDSMDQLPVSDVSRVLFSEGIHFV